MGRITEKVNKFLLRLANRLGIKKDNLLESAKENLKQMGPVINNAVPRDTGIKEEILSDRDKFAKELQEHATRFDPSFMSKEEAIMKILEQQGLNPEFAKNPAAMKQISEIGKNILQKEGIERVTKENLEEVKSKLQYSNIKIEDNGNMTYIETTYDNINRIESQDKAIFSIDDQGKFEKEKRNEDHWNVQKPGEAIQYLSRYTREKNVYNKYGLEMKKEYDSSVYNRNNDYDGLPQRESGRSFTIERNPDLVTATYRRQEVPNSIINNGYIDYSNQGRVIQYNMSVGGQYDKNKLVDYGNETFEQDEEQMREVNKNQGFVYVDQYDNFRTNEDVLKEFSKESEAFRKTAEEKGLIEREEELEQE